MKKYIPLIVIVGTFLAVIGFYFSDGLNFIKGDSWAYLEVLEKGPLVKNFGIALAYFFHFIGFSLEHSIIFLYSIILLSSTAMVFKFTRRYGLICATIATPLTMLFSYGLIWAYRNEAILGVGALLIMQLGLIMVASKYMKNRNSKWFTFTVALLLANVLFYKASGMMAFVWLGIYSIIKNDLKFSLCIAMLLPCSLLLWFTQADIINTALLELRIKDFYLPLTVALILANVPIYGLLSDRIWKWTFSNRYNIPFLIIIACYIIVSVFRNSYQHRLEHSLITLLWIMGSILAVSLMKRVFSSLRIKRA